MEKKLLSAMMLEDAAVIPSVVTLVAVEDFYRVEHRLIFKAMVEVYSRGTPPDVLLVEEELKRTGDLVKVNRKYLFSLIDYEFTTSRAEVYAKEIHNSATLRKMREACEEIAETIKNGEDDLEVLLETAEKKMFAAISERKSTLAKLEEPAMEVLKRLQEAMKDPTSTQGVPTGLRTIDSLLNGLQRSDMIILAARPGMGKTALALNVARNAARAGKVVAVFSLEMSKIQLAQRLISTTSGVDGQKIKSGNVSTEEFEDIIAAVDSLSELNLYIDDQAGQSMIEIRSKARKLAQEVGLDLIVVDYIQLMSGRRSENRQQEISDISRNMKALAREMNVPILALSQLSRAVEMRAEKKPQLSDLRESGSLEQDADIVMFLYREAYYNEEADNEHLAELNVAKNRNGETRRMQLYFDKETQLFGDFTRAEE